MLGTVSSVCKYFASKGYKSIENHQFFNSLISNISAANKNAVKERIIQILDLNEKKNNDVDNNNNNNTNNDVDKIAMELSEGVINMIKEKHLQFAKRQEKLESQLKSCNFFEKLLSQNIYQSEQSDNDNDNDNDRDNNHNNHHSHHSDHGHHSDHDRHDRHDRHFRHHPHSRHYDYDDYNINFAYKNNGRYFEKTSGRGHGDGDVHGQKSRSRFSDMDHMHQYECKQRNSHGGGGDFNFNSNFNSYGKHYVIGVCGKYNLESMKRAASSIMRMGSEYSCQFSVCDIIIFQDKKLFSKNISTMKLKKDCKCVTNEWLNDCLQCNQFIDIDKTYQLSLNDHDDKDKNVNNDDNENKNDNGNSNDNYNVNDDEEEVTVQTQTSSGHRARKRQFEDNKISMMNKFCMDDYDYVCENYNYHDHFDDDDDDEDDDSDVPPKKRQKLSSSQSNNKH